MGDGSGPSHGLTRSLSSSLPSPPHPSHPSHPLHPHRRSTETTLTGMSRRSTAGKSPVTMELPPLPIEGAPRLTRSAAKAAVPLRSQSDSGIKSLSINKEEVVKEKKKQLPLHKALQKAANLSRGMCALLARCIHACVFVLQCWMTHVCLCCVS